MTLSLALVLLSAAAPPTCEPAAPGAALAVPTEQAAVAAARIAWDGKFSAAAVEAHEPYRGQQIRGVWKVFGTLPNGWRGGTPEAVICASDGAVLKVFHTQ